MSRWDYDTVFYRVFCITLLAVAFTFTVILTSVFVDIDGLLSKKEKVKTPQPPPESLTHDLTELSRAINVNMDKSEDVYEDRDYQDSSDLYRSKRSLETPERIFHIKDPKVKKLLTNQLANLLDELDQQNNNNRDNIKVSINENNSNKKDKNKLNPDKTKDTNENANLNKDENKAKEVYVGIKEYLKGNNEAYKVNDKEVKSRKDYKAELLHLAMHNVIQQGLIENTNLDDMYEKVVDLVKDFENDHSTINKDDFRNVVKNVKSFEKRTDYSNAYEFRNFKEVLRKSDLVTERIKNENVTSEKNLMQITTTGKPRDHNVIIKTIIDITAMSNDKTNKDSDLNPKDKINGIIKLIYNGNVIKLKRIDDDNNTNSQSIIPSKLDLRAGSKDPQNGNRLSNSHVTKPHASNQSYYQNVFYDYLKRFKGSDSSDQEKVFSSKRLKRHIKIRYENNKTTMKPKTSKDDDELFVEIETHFDSKGTKGEKKKKLIRNLIEKIQKAIHSDNNPHKKKQQNWHVKKRIQNPLTSKSATALINKLILPLEKLAHRHLDPISKPLPLHEDIPFVNNFSGRNHWEEPYSPRFFGKAINSAEMNTVDTDYNRVLRHNGIPQRLQKPLNTDMSDEVFQDAKIVDLGNLQFLMKDLDGTGFSIGFNQYADEAPDSETMKLFSGLENIIKTYHQEYDQDPTFGNQQQNTYDNSQNIPPDDAYENDNEEQADNSNQHVIHRRSIINSDEIDNHPNSFQIVYGHNFVTRKNHNDIFASNKRNIKKMKNMKVYSMKNPKKSAFMIDENIFEKNLKPAEIFSIANLLQRKKRSLKVKKISSVKLKPKFNRYLNTKKMASKNVFKNNKQTKRIKRQIDKIRIIARDMPQNGKSEEDNVFVVSDENIFGDRALVREVELPELEPNDKTHSIEHYDIIPPQKEEEQYYDIVHPSQKVNNNEDELDIVSPYLYEVSPFESKNEFSRRARHNSLMSKYPHIIMEETPSYVNQGEKFVMDQQQQFNIEATTIPVAPTILDISSPNDQEIADFISPPSDHSNYRMSVKIRPKNATNMSGFKEVHTSINKIYNKNGLTYTSLVNVSQLSKVEKINKTLSKKETDEHAAQKVNLRKHHDVIKNLIQQHKHRLDMQLKHLQLEKNKLETLFGDNLETVSENVTEKSKTSPKKVRQPTQEEARKKLNHETTTTAQTTTTEPTTTEYVQTTPVDITLKTKMIETIERNENVTNELLKKIDLNTGVLKIFLGKLLATINVPTPKTETTLPKTKETNKNADRPINNESSTNKAVTKQPTNDQNIEGNHMPFNFEDYHYMPNIFRNMPKPENSSYGIPFVYAVQHPYGIMPNRDTVASVVYHGRIHSNTVNEDNTKKRHKNPAIKVVLQDKIKILTDKKNIDADFWKPKPGEKVLHDFVFNKNTTRFFLDDSQNAFTVVPRGGETNNTFPLGLVNNTKV